VPAIELRNLTRVFASGVTAVDRLTLDVDDGEFVVLVGPSGCGKTTALRMIAGLERITAGTVSIGGQVVNDVSPRRRDVAMVFQNYALYPHLSVYDNLGFALENAGVPKAERDRRIRAAAATLGLSELLRRRPRQLSGGQRQRVAMGRAIVREPRVFLMDEPLSNLDAKLRVLMRGEVLRVHRSVGAATVYVTHDQVEAMTMGDRIAVLNGGTLQQFGPPGELYARPVNQFVARFIGSPEMNLYEAALDADGALVLGSQRVMLGPRPGPGQAGPGTAVQSTAVPGAAMPGGARPGQPVSGLARPGQAGRDRPGPRPGEAVIVGIRPEDLTLGAPGDPGALAADVRAVEQLGSELHAFFAIDARQAGGQAGEAGDDKDAVLPGQSHNGVARLDPRSGVRPGSRVTFLVDPGRLYFFEPATGEATAWPGSAIQVMTVKG
jgi:multiple sugar transport system ATP-binding protein